MLLCHISVFNISFEVQMRENKCPISEGFCLLPIVCTVAARCNKTSRASRLNTQSVNIVGFKITLDCHQSNFL